jgi:hypothetical protein
MKFINVEARGSTMGAKTAGFLFSVGLLVVCYYVARFGVGYFAIAAIAAFFGSWAFSRWISQRSS